MYSSHLVVWKPRRGAVQICLQRGLLLTCSAGNWQPCLCSAFRTLLGLSSSCVHVCSVAQSCPTLCNSMDCSPPGSSVHGISQARILEWVAISCHRGSSWPRDWTCVSWVSCTGKLILCHWATWGTLAGVEGPLFQEVHSLWSNMLGLPGPGYFYSAWDEAPLKGSLCFRALHWAGLDLGWSVW